MKLKDVIDIGIAFIIAWLIYQFLSIILITPVPLVAVVSNSMEPKINVGDLLVVTGYGDYKLNDIVVYHKPSVGFDIVHRIINETSDGYVTKGDNNPYTDNWIVKRKEILGKVIIAIPLLGYPRIMLYFIGL